MVSLTSCKMFMATRNKTKVLCAVKDPINSPLIQQLKSYVNFPDDSADSVKFPSESEKPDSVKHDIDNNGTQSPDIHKSDKGSDISDKSSNSDTHTEDINVPSSDKSEQLPEDSENSEDNLESDNSTSNDEETAENDSSVDSSTSVYGQTALYSNNTCNQIDLSTIPTEIKGLLNLRSDTSGVQRVAIKDQELWVYYSDNVNLNNNMVQVIEVIQAANYYYLQFNRLARSDNAIVFEINLLTDSTV